MIRERIQEIADFVKSESPYRSANKGWLTDDIYFQRGPNTSNPSNKFDQLLKVQFFLQPLIQVAVTIFLVISFATVFAFTPLAFLNGRFDTISKAFELIKVEIPSESSQSPIEKTNSFEDKIENKIDIQKTVEKPITTKFNKDQKTNQKGNSGLVLRF